MISDVKTTSRFSRDVAAAGRIAALLLASAALLPGSQETAWQAAGPGFSWSFPRDHWSHPGFATEWWYLTGHLEAEDGRRFGYQFTFFRVGLLVERPPFDSKWSAADLVMGHASISDLDTGTHRFSELVYRATPLLGGFGEAPDPLLVWSRAPAGTDARWTLAFNGEAFDLSMRDDALGMSFELSTRPLKPLVFQGPGGVSRKGKGPTSASLYYSFTRLETRGTLTVDGEHLEVRGTSWMDKEFGSNQLGDDQVGWDWFSLQLDDGRELMLYVLRDAAGDADLQSGTLVLADGSTRHLDGGEFAVEALASWESPHTGTPYPARWRLRIEGLDGPLEVVPLAADQENRSRLLKGMHYWEGAVEVRDGSARPLGRGYVELTGYGDAVRPGI